MQVCECGGGDERVKGYEWGVGVCYAGVWVCKGMRG